MTSSPEYKPQQANAGYGPGQYPASANSGQRRADSDTSLFLSIFAGHKEPFGFVSADIQPRTPHHRHDLITASDADGVGRPGMGGKVVGDMLRTLADTNVLSAADVRDHLAAPEQGRGAIDKRRRAIERLRHDRVNPDSGMVGLEAHVQGVSLNYTIFV